MKMHCKLKSEKVQFRKALVFASRTKNQQCFSTFYSKRGPKD